MRNLVALSHDPIADYDEIVAAKHLQRRKRLLVARPAVEARFDSYTNAVPRLEHLPSSAVVAPLDDDLRHCYVNATAPMSKLKAQIKTAQPPVWQGLCPYCGVDSPRTYDHYLCKEHFPEFSTLHSNLIPSCGTCNLFKGDRELEGGVRQFIHFYFDALPSDEQWLQCKLAVSGRDITAAFSLVCPGSVSNELWTLLSRHYEKLHLLERYREKASEVLSETLLIAGRSSADEYAREFSLKGIRWSALYGASHWKCVLYTALASSEDFLALMV